MVPVIFTIVGLAFVVSGLRSLRTARRFRAVALRAPGLVTDLRFHSTAHGRGGTWFPVLRFTTADGRHVETQAMYGRRPPAAQPGDAVTVAYDPADPTTAALEGGAGGGLIGILFVTMGSTFAALGLAIGVVFLLLRNVL